MGTFPDIIMGLLFNPYALVVWVVILYEIYTKIFPKVRNKIYELETYKDIQTLSRDIDCNYNPSVLSILVNNEINIKSLSADIMNLYARRILDIEEISNEGKKQYKIKLNVEDVDTLELLDSDRYLLYTLFEKRTEFEFEIWKKRVNKEYNKLNFSQPYNRLKISRFIKAYFITYILLCVITFIITTDIFDAIVLPIVFTSALFFIISIFLSINEKVENKRRHLNKKGKNEAKKWMKFKKFIEEYTLIKEKNIEDIIIYEKYIPYSVVLDINNNYKGTIYSIFSEEEIKKLLVDINGYSIIEKHLGD